MPLVKLFARKNLAKAVPLVSIQSKLCEIWGTTPDTTKLMLFRCEDWTDESFQEDIYVDIRAYGKKYLVLLIFHVPYDSLLCTGKPERTREMVLQGMKGVHQAFRHHDLTANVRLETYEGDRYFHLPPTKV